MIQNNLTLSQETTSKKEQICSKQTLKNKYQKTQKNTHLSLTKIKCSLSICCNHLFHLWKQQILHSMKSIRAHQFLIVKFLTKMSKNGFKINLTKIMIWTSSTQINYLLRHQNKYCQKVNKLRNSFPQAKVLSFCRNLAKILN